MSTAAAKNGTTTVHECDFMCARSTLESKLQRKFKTEHEKKNQK